MFLSSEPSRLGKLRRDVTTIGDEPVVTTVEYDASDTCSEEKDVDSLGGFPLMLLFLIELSIKKTDR